MGKVEFNGSSMPPKHVPPSLIKRPTDERALNIAAPLPAGKAVPSCLLPTAQGSQSVLDLVAQQFNGPSDLMPLETLNPGYDIAQVEGNFAM